MQSLLPESVFAVCKNRFGDTVFTLLLLTVVNPHKSLLNQSSFKNQYVQMKSILVLKVTKKRHHKVQVIKVHVS